MELHCFPENFAHSSNQRTWHGLWSSITGTTIGPCVFQLPVTNSQINESSVWQKLSCFPVSPWRSPLRSHCCCFSLLSLSLTLLCRGWTCCGFHPQACALKIITHLLLIILSLEPLLKVTAQCFWLLDRWTTLVSVAPAISCKFSSLVFSWLVVMFSFI